jgi:hypothetical protein
VWIQSLQRRRELAGNDRANETRPAIILWRLDWATVARLEAMAVEKAIRLGIPAAFAGGAYSGYL